MSAPWFVYIIKTSKNNLYTGITVDLARRFQQHLDVYDNKKNAKGAKFFRSQKPIEIVYQQQLESRSLATQREMYIKKMTRNEKLLLCENIIL